MPASVFAILRTINTLICVRVDFQSARFDGRSALDTDTVITGLKPPQCRRNFREFVSGLVTQRIDNFIVFELLGTLFRISLITTPQIRIDAVKACRKFGFFGFENSPELVVSTARHTVLLHKIHA
jgi:hypothetical protein